VSKSGRNVWKGVLDLEIPKRYRSDCELHDNGLSEQHILEYKTINLAENAPGTQSKLCFEK
jgi:hypothetical protein